MTQAQTLTLPALPAYECGPHTGHAAVRTDAAILAWGQQCAEAATAPLVAEIKRLQREVVNRNQRALDGDEACVVRAAALDENEQLRAELLAIRAQKSVAETTCDCYPDHGGTIYAEAVLPRGTPLYASPKDNDAGLIAKIDSLQRTLRQEALARENVTAMRDQLRAQVAKLEKDAATLVNAIKLDRHDWEDWPKDSRNAFAAIARKATP